MLRDPVTGKGLITRAQAVHFAERTGVPESYFGTSDANKRRELARTFEKLSPQKSGGI